MKILTIVFLIVLFSLSQKSYAQSGCMTCCDESFPYTLCPGDTAGCWASPSDGTQAKAHIPGKICLDQLPNNMIWMPKDSFDNSGWLPTDLHLGDSGAVQLDSDISRIFFEELQPVDLNPANFNSHTQFLTDNQMWLDTMNRYYKKIWDYNQAVIDAQTALDHWISICPELVKDTTCCIHINYATDNPVTKDDSTKKNKFTGFYASGYASTDFPSCTETSCSSTRSLTVNCTDEGRFNVLNPREVVTDDRYGLVVVPEIAFWTGKTHPTGIAKDPNDSLHQLISWYQLMEHEIGHFLGLWHPDHPAGRFNQENCTNNTDTASCHGVFAVMQQGENIKNTNPQGLQAVDSCMFKKLYCYSDLGCSSGVKDESKAHNEFSPRIYPNPSTGVMFLSYSVSTRSRVQISLLDLLGKSIIEVVNAEQSQGDYTISLPTQYLATGHYVCRVSCGDNQADLNVVILK